MDGTGWNAEEGTRRPSNYENFKVSKRRMTKLHRFLTKLLFGKTLDERHGNGGWNRMECRRGDEESDRSRVLRKFQSLKATNDEIASSDTFPDKIGKTLDERHGNDGWNRMECRGGDEESDRGPLNGKVCGGKGRGRAVSRAGRIVIIQHVCTCARTTTGEYRLEVAIPS